VVEIWQNGGEKWCSRCGQLGMCSSIGSFQHTHLFHHFAPASLCARIIEDVLSYRVVIMHGYRVTMR